MEKTVHFSIDDCLPAIKYFTLHPEQFQSIFDMEFYGTLYEYHKKYGCIFHLYFYSDVEDFSIQDVNEKCREEFRRHQDWLRLGYHGSKNFDNERTLQEFQLSFQKTKQSISHFASSENWDTKIRLHQFLASKEEVEFLRQEGINGLFSAYDDRDSYDLDEQENYILRSEGTYTKNGMEYVRSDFCVEFETLEKLNQLESQDKVVIFAHQWKFCKEKEKIDFLMEWLEQHTYTYI